MHSLLYLYLVVTVSLKFCFLEARPKLNPNSRNKRGILSKSGVCPNPVYNLVTKDTRLNFYGVGYVLPGMESISCSDSECVGDIDCEGDMKCCTNRCGGQVCTEAVREAHPCELFVCPSTKICKIQRVRCIDPDCPDLYAVSRPVCVSGGPIYEMGRKRSRIPKIGEEVSHPSLEEIEKERRKMVHFQPAEPYYKN